VDGDSGKEVSNDGGFFRRLAILSRIGNTDRNRIENIVHYFATFHAIAKRQGLKAARHFLYVDLFVRPHPMMLFIVAVFILSQGILYSIRQYTGNGPLGTNSRYLGLLVFQFAVFNVACSGIMLQFGYILMSILIHTVCSMNLSESSLVRVSARVLHYLGLWRLAYRDPLENTLVCPAGLFVGAVICISFLSSLVLSLRDHDISRFDSLVLCVQASPILFSFLYSAVVRNWAVALGESLLAGIVYCLFYMIWRVHV
jgi:hypothetical protein